MEKYDTIPSAGGEMSSKNLQFFKGWVLGAQGLSLSAVIMVAVWLGHYRGGFAWQEDPEKEFNYHPLFMIIGMVFFYGNAILMYRVFRHTEKIYIKILHLVLHILALVFAGIGLKAVFDFHNLTIDDSGKSIPNLYSLHSWLGIITIIFFALQWIAGLVTFLVPGLAADLRAAYKPVHVFWGLVIFILAIATCLIGFTEAEIFHNKKYNTKNSEGILVNCLSLVLVALAIVLSYILTNSAYKREPLPEEDQIQLTQ